MQTCLTIVPQDHGQVVLHLGANVDEDCRCVGRTETKAQLLSGQISHRAQDSRAAFLHCRRRAALGHEVVPHQGPTLKIPSDI